MVMIQRHADDAPVAEDEADKPVDPYNGEDPSPMTSGAINSSCWELATLQKHYLSSISTLAKVFTEVFTKPEYNMEDFLDHGYDTVSIRCSTGLTTNSLTVVRNGDEPEDQEPPCAQLCGGGRGGCRPVPQDACRGCRG